MASSERCARSRARYWSVPNCLISRASLASKDSSFKGWPIAGIGQRRAVEVALRAKESLVDPIRVIEAKRDFDQASVETVDEPGAPSDGLHQLIKVHGTRTGGAGVVDRKRPDVHRGTRRFGVQESGVERR